MAYKRIYVNHTKMPLVLYRFVPVRIKGEKNKIFLVNFRVMNFEWVRFGRKWFVLRGVRVSCNLINLLLSVHSC